MLEIGAAFLFILVTHFFALLKAGLKGIIIFGLVWTAGLALALLVASGIFLPVIGPLNQLYYFLLELFPLEN